MWIQGLPKGLEVLPKGLEYALLITEHAAGKQRLCLRNSLSSLTCFLILPDEFIDNQIDNLAITKNCQKGPRAARDPIQPGVAHFNFASMSWNIYLGWSSLALKPSVEYNFDLKIRAAAQQCKNQAVLREIPSALWRQHSGQQTADHEVPLLLILWRWVAIDLQVNSHCLTCAKTK